VTTPRRNIRRERLESIAEDADDEEEGDEEEESPSAEEIAQTSLSDLTTEADPEEFGQTFTSGDANLNIQGAFNPVAGDLQAIPRVAYVINLNFVYNEERGRWEPKKKGRLIDDFEDGDLAEYIGETGQFDVVEDPEGAFNGDFYLTTNVVDTGNFSIFSPEDGGLNYYPERGDAVRAAVQARQFPTPSSALMTGLAAGSNPNSNVPDNGYAVALRYGFDDLRVIKFKNGSVAKSDTADFPTDSLENVWVEIGLRPEVGGTVEAFASVPDENISETVAITDSEFDSGGWSWGVRHDSNSTAGDTRWDFARRVA